MPSNSPGSKAPPSPPHTAAVSDPSSETEAADTSVEGSSIKFKCDQCSYTKVSKKGLEQHIGMKHRISQVDGIMDSDKETMEDIVTLELHEAGEIVGSELP